MFLVNTAPFFRANSSQLLICRAVFSSKAPKREKPFVVNFFCRHQNANINGRFYRRVHHGDARV